MLILEFHDDVLVLDREVDPIEVEFFQVKTRKDGHWSKQDLLKAAKPSIKRKTKKMGTNGGDVEVPPRCSDPPPRSILGKLLEHCRHFLPQVKSLNIVSNVTFNLPLCEATASSDRDKFCLSELKDDALVEVKEAVKKELEIEEDLPWEKVFLLACGISITEHEKYGTGQLAEFLDQRRPGGRFAVHPLFRTLCGELGRRATNEWQPTSFEELCQKKGFRRIDLEKFLRVAESQPYPEDQLEKVKEQLLREGLDYRGVAEIEAAWRRYDIQKIDRADMTVQTLKNQLVAVVGVVAPSTAWRSLREFIAEAQTTFVRLHGLPSPPFDIKYLQGALLHEFKTFETRQLPPPDSQPSSGTP